MCQILYLWYIFFSLKFHILPFNFAGDISDKYDGLLGQINDHMNTLRGALSQSQDIQDNLDSLLRWLAKVEGEFSQLENAVVVAKREPMEELCNRQKVCPNFK